MFGHPIDLTCALNLKTLHLKGMAANPLTESEDGALFFKSFCDFVRGTVITTMENATLQHLKLHFFAVHDHKIFLQPAFWEVPTWKQMCDTISDDRLRKRPQSLKVSLDIVFDSAQPIPEDIRPSITSKIKGFVAGTAPNIDIGVAFSSTAISKTMLA